MRSFTYKFKEELLDNENNKEEHESLREKKRLRGRV